MIGALGVTHSEPGQFDSQHSDLVQLIAHCATPAIEIAQLRSLALRDELTRVPNSEYMRGRLQEEIHRVSEGGRGLTFAFIDIDDLGVINQTCRRRAGDRVIQDVGTLLASHSGPTGVLARWESNTFALLLPDCAPGEGLERVRRAVVEASRLRIKAEALHISTTLSAGVTHLEGRAATIDELALSAQRALDEAKSRGKNRVMVAEDLRFETPVEGELHVVTGEFNPTAADRERVK